MVFVTVGSQKFQFNRLLKEIDRLIESGIIKDKVIAQRGASDYVPIHYEYFDFMNKEIFNEVIDKSDAVITHGGTGAIIGALKKGKKVIAVPRLAKYGEHVDDHQLQLLAQFENANLIFVCREIAELGELYLKLPDAIFAEYKSNQMTIVNDIEQFILNVKK